MSAKRMGCGAGLFTRQLVECVGQAFEFVAKSQSAWPKVRPMVIGKRRGKLKQHFGVSMQPLVPGDEEFGCMLDAAPSRCQGNRRAPADDSRHKPTPSAALSFSSKAHAAANYPP